MLHLNLSEGIKQEKTRKKGVRRKKKQNYRKQHGFGEVTNAVPWLSECSALSRSSASPSLGLQIWHTKGKKQRVMRQGMGQQDAMYSGHDKVIAIRTSQWLWLPALSLSETGCLSTAGGGDRGSSATPLLDELLIVSGRRGIILFSSVPTGAPKRLY